MELCQLPPSPPHLLPPLFLFLENEPGFLLDDVLGGEVRFGGAWKTIGGMMEMKTTVKPNSLLHQRRRTRDLIYLSSVGRLQLFTLISERQPHTPPPPDEPLFSHRKRKERKMQTKINQKKKEEERRRKPHGRLCGRARGAHFFHPIPFLSPARSSTAQTCDYVGKL